ncbi:MAG: protein phosphatase 2C domain-containing protein [Gammaproteobacteria bacterium]|nr:protein phosphatase 2C domain-containing protein [Gammaproteobacteria bacterium]
MESNAVRTGEIQPEYFSEKALPCSDHYFTIGRTHRICEDYVVQGAFPTPFIALSDGCSSSENTHIGARILTMSAKNILESTEDWPPDYMDFGGKLIDKARYVVKKLQLDNCVLDATLMLAFLYNDSIQVYVYGDGALLFKDKAGKTGTIEIAFTHNAPYYLSYWHDAERQALYAKHEEKPLAVMNSAHEKAEAEPIAYSTPLRFTFPLEKYKFVGIASDGVTQVIDTVLSARVPLDEVARDLLAFEDLEGKFVKDHTERVLRQYENRRRYPADDLSIGVFAW